MEKNNETRQERWVDERLATLDPGGEWRPNPSQGLARLRERHDAGRRHRGRWTWIAATAMVACLGAVTIPETRVFAARCVGACSEAGTRIWQSFSNSQPSLATVAKTPDANPKGIGEMAPEFTLYDISGSPVKLSDFRGKVVLLNFWATWCPPCKAEMPWFCEFEQSYKDQDFVVLGVSVDEDGWKSVKPFVNQNQINYRVMVDDGKTTALYGGVKSLPATFLIDRSGRIAASYIGLVSRSDYQTEIEALLKK